MFGIGSLLTSGLGSVGYKAICLVYCQGVKPILKEKTQETGNEWDNWIYQMLNRVFDCEDKGGK